MYTQWLLLLSIASTALGLNGKCNHKPPLTTEATPSENKGYFILDIENADRSGDKIFYIPDQTYVLTITASNSTRPFRWFMITAEDPIVDNSIDDFIRKSANIGTLKTLDTTRSRYSEQCASTVENSDFSDKYRIAIHWLSPKSKDTKQQVRIRAMVAENDEVWYTGDHLTILLNMDVEKAKDSPPVAIKEVCTLCSEARYELIFKGKWSRVAHPRHYPSKPDENGYSHMIGASHGHNFTLWQQGGKATEGLKELAEKADVSVIEREIIDAMTLGDGTRTLIRGKRRHHPYMSEPSHSLFRVDSIHHMFSVAIGMRPSPDWFLGTSKFELCKDDEWLEEFELPLYPWDAGTSNGVSYESPVSMTQPSDNVERVPVGSFIEESPFYQMNFNDLQPFAMLYVRRLDVYPLVGVKCDGGEVTEDTEAADETTQEDEPSEEPMLAESRQNLGSVEARCDLDERGEWSECVPGSGL